VPTPPEQTFAAYQEHLGRGHQLLARGDAKAALAAYRAAAELADERPLPHVLVGRALLALNRAAEALAAFERALERAAADPSALAGKAEALLRLGRRDDAAAVRQQLDDAAAAATAALAAAAASLPPAEAQALASGLGRKGATRPRRPSGWPLPARMPLTVTSTRRSTRASGRSSLTRARRAFTSRCAGSTSRPASSARPSSGCCS
jgi:tetratricopeptide (TPR) repeat protein